VNLLVLSRLEQFVPSQIRHRGAAYARGGVVRTHRIQENVVSATVTGSDIYLITLRYEERTLWATCTCPYFEDNFEICKHIWATLLTCQSKKIGFSGPVDDLLIDDQAETIPFSDDDEDFTEDDFDFDEPVSPLRSYRPYRRPYVEPSRWRSQIGSLAPYAYDLAGNARIPPEILWVIDPATSSTAVLIEIASRTPKKNGELGKPQTFSLPVGAISRLPDARDREILSILAARSYEYGMVDARQSIAWPAAEYLVPKLIESGRLWIRSGKGTYETGVRFDGGEPWRLAVRAEERDGKYVLTGTLRRGEESISVREPLAVTRGGFVIFRDSIARFADEETHAWAALLRREDVTIPAKEINAFLKAIAASASPLPIELPAALRWEERRVAPRAAIELQARSWDSNMNAVPTFHYDGLTVNALARTRALYDETSRSIVLRDAEAESQRLDALWGQGFTTYGDALSIPRARLAEAIPRLIEAGWEVRGTDGVYAGGGELELSLRGGIDWFDLHAAATFEGQRVRLPRLLTALRKGESFVRLDDGKLGLIRPEWRAQLEPFLATASGEHDDGLRFRRNQVMLLDALLATRQNVAFDEVFDRARRKVLDTTVAPESAPPTFRGALRPYQQEGLGWFSFLRELGFGGCLADDMGLGKTVQVLALLDQRRGAPAAERRPSLVIAPRSLVFNWKAEAARFTPELRVLDHATPDRLPTTDHFRDYDLVLTTYALLRREAELFAGVELDYAILDEAQAIKNASSQAAKAVTLLQARHRLALTGTPVENHLGELASLFEFLNPGMLRAKSTRVTKLLRDAGRKTPEAAEARTMLAKTVRPFILRRTKGQVAPELPERVEQTIWCELEPKQRKLYDELRDYYRASLLRRVADKGLATSKIHILEALLRMRQAACHPGLVDAKRRGEAAAKLDTLFEELPVLLDERHKVLVFSQFTSLLSIVRDGMHQRGIAHSWIDGKSRDREEQVQRFQNDPKVPVFLISLKAGGLGLNLTAAEYVFLLDPWWNPAVEAQAIDRAHRIGQSRNVMAYRLVARDTIEEKILQLQESKRSLAEAIIGEENSILRQITTEDLELLLS
jgi:superfamily II DNA or RNA helicase